MRVGILLALEFFSDIAYTFLNPAQIGILHQNAGWITVPYTMAIFIALAQDIAELKRRFKL